MKRIMLVALLTVMLSGCSAGGHINLYQNDSTYTQNSFVA